MLRALLLLILLVPAVAAAVPALAVLDLDNQTGDRSLDGAGAGVAGVLVAKLTRTDAVTVVERRKLHAVLDEIALGASGAVDPDTAAEAGRLIGADYVVTGAVASVRLPSVGVSVQVVDVDTGEVLVADEVTGDVGSGGEAFFVLVDELAFRIVDALEVELSTRDRIELGQVDVRRLDALQRYGEALQALDDGDRATAERLLGRAVALEPGFTLASDALASLAVEVGTRRAEQAVQAMQDAQEWRDRLVARAEVDAGQPTWQGMVGQAVVARVHLVEGRFDAYLEAEQARREAFPAFWKEVRPKPGEMYLHSPGQRITDRIAALTEAEGTDRPGLAAFDGWAFWPWEIATQEAEVRMRLGQRAEAVGMLVDTWRTPGPTDTRRWGEDPPMPDHPRDVVAAWGLHEDHLAFLEQDLRRAELANDEPRAKELVREMDDLVRVVTGARAVQAWEPKGRKAAAADLVEERAALARYADVPAELWPAYVGFLRRVEQGYYDKVRDASAFRRLAEDWRGLADGHWQGPIYAERRLDHLLRLREMLPDGADDPEIAAALQASLEEAYP